MLEMEVSPGKSLGQFYIGQPANEAIALISKEYKRYKRVRFIFNDEDPFSDDVLIDVQELCIQLRIDALTQRTKSIEVYDFQHVSILYGKSSFGGSSSQRATFADVEHTFGVTRTEYDPVAHAHLLKYPGLRFAFAVPPELQEEYASGSHNLAQERVFTDGSPANLSSLWVFAGRAPVPANPFHNEVVEVMINEGIHLTKQNIKLHFGASVQDLLTQLGRPEDVYFKNENTMKIFLESEGNAPAHSSSHDCYYNYPALGIDILVDGKTQTARKFILHNNLPNHVDFGMYARCNFLLKMDRPQQLHTPVDDIALVPTQLVSEQPRSSLALQKPSSEPVPSSGKKKHQAPSDWDSAAITIQPATQWDRVRRALRESVEKEVVFNPPMEDNAVNPFPAPTLWGMDGAIFEVTASGHIATITLFSNDS